MKLNIGSGCIPPGSIFTKDWVNVDFSYKPDSSDWKHANYMNFDLSERWLIDTESVDCIYASHILEHFEYTRVWNVIRESYRVLKTGHPIRVICPDPRIFVRNWQVKNKSFIIDCYDRGNWDRWDYEHNLNIAFTDMFFHDHYDHALCPSIDYIMILMIRTGFPIIQEMNCGNTMFPEFFKDKTEVVGLVSFDNRPVMSYYLEAIK